MSNEPVQFSFPTTVDFGVGALRNLPKWTGLHGKRALLVTDPGLAELDVFQRVRQVLTTSISTSCMRFRTRA